jgi:hypothetical protein
MKRWVFRILILFALALAALFAIGRYNGRNRFPGYKADLDLQPGAPAALKAGFSALPITPDVPDTWTDANKDAQYDPEDGDTFEDKNGNGRFDAFWMAGFQNKRPAAGVHDDLWARAMVIDDGKTRLAIVSLDLIGFGNDDVVRVRKRLSPAAGITYAMIGSTHVHAAPDMLGIWGPSDYKTGLNPAFSERVIALAAKAVEQAAVNLRPAHLIVAQDLRGAAHLVEDTRDPQVLDPALNIVQALDAENGASLGALVVWGNHPETTWAENLLLTSDFPHYVRESLEKGIFKKDSLVHRGIGGTVVYLSGAIGGLMTTGPGLVVRDTFTGEAWKEPSFEKARAEGEQLAVLATAALRNSKDTIKTGSLGVLTRSIELPLDNKLFRLGVALDLFNRGYTSYGLLRSEVALVTLGELSLLAVPGEIYPEIIHGGIENPPGADFDTPPVETPPLLSLMPGKYRFVLGLMNDELGYIIPRSEWDTAPPYLYGAKEPLYGEINSCGAATAPGVYEALKALCRQQK